MRPKFEEIASGKEFNTWYWSKDEMLAICKQLGLPTQGRKFDLRDRIMHALDQGMDTIKPPKSAKGVSKFNWAKATLTLETKITDSVSFGPNFRSFMKEQIGSKFKCHSDFMDWVKGNVGSTLGDAVVTWKALEDRKKDPSFKRIIADNNMYAQYIRDFLEDNPGLSLEDVKHYWELRKKLPMENGFIRYSRSDSELS